MLSSRMGSHGGFEAGTIRPGAMVTPLDLHLEDYPWNEGRIARRVSPNQCNRV
jgi:hypothetical protein